MKNRYLSIVKETVNKIDPIGLLRQGAPKDEYDFEIQQLASKLDKCGSIEDIQKAAYNIFRDNFGADTAGDLNLYLDLAKGIFDKITPK